MKRHFTLTSTKEAKRQAKLALKHLQQLHSGRSSPLKGMAQQEAIEQIRKVREELWEAKVASRP